MRCDFRELHTERTDGCASGFSGFRRSFGVRFAAALVSTVLGRIASGRAAIGGAASVAFGLFFAALHVGYAGELGAGGVHVFLHGAAEVVQEVVERRCEFGISECLLDAVALPVQSFGQPARAVQLFMRFGQCSPGVWVPDFLVHARVTSSPC